MSSNKSQVLVTGGAGFIGSHLVERLLKEGKRVVVVDDFSTGQRENLTACLSNPNFTLVESKISAWDGLGKCVEQCEAIYHLAAAVGVELVVKAPIHVLKANLSETEVLLSAAAPWKVPLLLTSTSEVYGKSMRPGFSEEDDLLIGPPHQARWGYACSKLVDEFLALAYWHECGLPVRIVRLFNTVGPRQTGRYGMVLPRFIAAAKAGEPLKVYGDGEQTRCFCYVHDAVEAILRLQKNIQTAGQIYNVGSTEEVSIRQLAEHVIATLGSRSSIVTVPYEQAYAPGFEDMRRRKPIVEKLDQTIGFKPETSLREIILRTAAAKL